MHVRLFLRYSPKTAPSEISAKMATAQTKIRSLLPDTTRWNSRVRSLGYGVDLGPLLVVFGQEVFHILHTDNIEIHVINELLQK